MGAQHFSLVVLNFVSKLKSKLKMHSDFLFYDKHTTNNQEIGLGLNRRSITGLKWPENLEFNEFHAMQTND